MPEISVIIPVYNKEKYIEDSVDSVLSQSFEDFEIIAVNDGSTDGSLSILERLAKQDQRIRVFDVPNGGVSSARNIGLQYATGNWIQFLDGDDRLEADYFEQAMTLLEKDSADILFSGFTMVDEQMKPVREVTIPEEGSRNRKELCDSFIRYQYTTGYFGFISNKLFRRMLLEKAGARFPVGTTLAEDLHFFARLYPYAERVRFWKGKSFFYLQTETNYLNNPDIDYYSQIKVHLQIKAWFEQMGLYETYRTQLDLKISQYAGFILFYDNEAGKTLGDAYSFLTGSREIIDCIDPGLVTGFSRQVLRCLKNRNYLGICSLYLGRNCVRALYRMVKKYE